MAPFRIIFGHVRANAALMVAFIIFSASFLSARDAFVMLSGGVSPFDNNYSQYLQARAVVAFFERNYPRDSIWVFFGAGNVEGEQPIFCDVRREIKPGGVRLNSWLAGSLNHNRPARKDVILRALREEILPAIADGGTLYLLVGDHGSQSRTNSESEIDLWGLDRDEANERGWRSTRDEALTVTDLRRALAAGIGKGRVVFCMTQCHSGGFHHLAVAREMTANPKWFRRELTSLKPAQEQLFLENVAGFTATDERSLAAGCQPDPEPLNWAGYERYFPERLFGMDMFTLERAQKGLRSFGEAHAAATLVDQTIDKPYATTEAYLERWATLIETKLLKNADLSDSLKKRVAAYQRTVDGATPKELDLGFRERQALFRQFTDKLIEQNSSLKSLLRSGSRKDLEQAIGITRGRSTNQAPSTTTNTTPRTTTQRSGRRTTTNAPSETLKLWNETLRPAWSAAMKTNGVQDVVGLAIDFEKHLLSKETNNRDYFSSASRSRLQEEAFWKSGYSDPRHLDPKRAEAIIRWGATRRAGIVAWARTSDDEAVRAAGEKLWQRTPGRTNAPLVDPPVQSVRTNQPSATPASRQVSRKIAAERVLFYRRVLAAWEFLLAVNERPALARVRELSALERTPLPRPIAERELPGRKL